MTPSEALHDSKNQRRYILKLFDTYMTCLTIKIDLLCCQTLGTNPIGPQASLVVMILSPHSISRNKLATEVQKQS